MRKLWIKIGLILVPFALVFVATPALADGTVEEGLKAYQAQEYDKAYKILLPHANTYFKPGFIEAQWLVGNIYLAGKSVEQSVPTAWMWHQKAIKNAYAVKNYALIKKIIQPYLDNNLIEGKIEYAKLVRRAGNLEQMKEARAFIEKAAADGNAMAQYEMRKLGSGFADKIAQYRYQAKWLKLSADQGYAPAQIAYGEMFRHGGPAVTQKIFSEDVLKNWPDDEDARRQWKKDQHIKWALKAAMQNDMDGEFAVAIAYKNNGDRENAMVHYARAAKLGHFKAELEQAKGYDVGLGVTQDQQRAANLYQDIMDRVSDDVILIDNDWKYVRADATRKLNELKKNSGIIPKRPKKPQWLVGKWGEVEEDGKGGYRETTGLLANSCADHDGRGYAAFSFKNNELIAGIIGNTAATIMFDAFEEKPAPYTALDDTHVEVYPAQWGEGWLMLEQVGPEVLKVVVHGGDSRDRNFFLKLCQQ